MPSNDRYFRELPEIIDADSVPGLDRYLARHELESAREEAPARNELSSSNRKPRNRPVVPWEPDEESKSDAVNVKEGEAKLDNDKAKEKEGEATDQTKREDEGSKTSKKKKDGIWAFLFGKS